MKNEQRRDCKTHLGSTLTRRTIGSGAPSNDLLNEKMSDRTELNAHAYKYASYMNQIALSSFTGNSNSII